MKKIIITGGHLTPALATIEQLKSAGEWQIYYLGRKYSFEGIKILSQESKVIKKVGVEFIPIIAGRFQRKFTRHTIPSLLRIPFAFIQSFCLVGRIRPNLVLSFGSYVSVPVVFSAWLWGVPIVSHEQTVTRGLANRFNAFFSTLIAVSYQESLSSFLPGKVVFTGNPVRQEIFKLKRSLMSKKVEKVLEELKLPLIYVTGGNQGAQAINKVLRKSLPILLKNYLIIHQTGSLDYEKNLLETKKLPSELKKRYFVKDFVKDEEIGWVLNKASLVVSRSGANITWEVGVLGKPTIFIPLPIAGENEQMKNAAVLKNLGLAQVISQQNLTPNRLARLIEKVFTNYEDYKKAGKNAAKFFFKQGAKKLVDKIYELLNLPLYN